MTGRPPAGGAGSVTHLVVTDAFAGVERYVANVAAETARRGWEVRVLGGRESQMRAALPDEVAWRPAPDLPRALAAMVAAPRADVVHVHLTAAEIAAAAVPGRGRIVATRHLARPRGSSRLHRAVAGLAARRIDTEVAISHAVRRACGTPGARVLLTGVPDRTTARRPERTVVVAQRFEAEKHTDVAVRAFAASGLAADGWRLVLHGEGAEEPALRGLAEGLGLTAVVDWPGWAADMGDVFARAGIVLAPTENEGFGLVVAEAMAAAAPVVASRSGGHRETVGAADPTHLFVPGDPDDAERRLRAVGDLDETARADYGLRLRSWQREHLSLAGHVSALLDLYSEGRPRG